MTLKIMILDVLWWVMWRLIVSLLKLFVVVLRRKMCKIGCSLDCCQCLTYIKLKIQKQTILTLKNEKNRTPNTTISSFHFLLTIAGGHCMPPWWFAVLHTNEVVLLGTVPTYIIYVWNCVRFLLLKIEKQRIRQLRLSGKL